MKFIVSRFYTPKSVVLKYLVYEYSLYTDWGIDGTGVSLVVDFEVYLNYLCLASFCRRVGFFDIDGYFPYRGWIPRTLDVPGAVIRDILPQGKYEGFPERAGEAVPCYFDKTSNWICCGDPERAGMSVQFTGQAIATLNGEGQLTALWLKPVFVSTYETLDEFAAATGVDRSRVVIAQ